MAIFSARRSTVPVPGFTAAEFSSQPYTTELGPSNTVQPVNGVVGAFAIPASYGSWQQPVTAPPTPIAGVKSILPQQPTVHKPARQTVKFTPAPNYSLTSI